MTQTTALVVEGGAMRGIFSAGILDSFIAADFYPFSACYGVSAGGNTLAAYLAGMEGRSYRIYTEFSRSPEFLSVGKFIRGGHFLDLDWMWDITIREVPLKRDVLYARGIPFHLGFTDTATGEAFFAETNSDNLIEYLKASSAIPIYYRNTFTIEGRTVMDGGMAAPIPAREAYNRGARNILVIRSRPKSYVMKPSRGSLMMKLFLGKHPGLVEALRLRYRRYNDDIEFIRNPPADAVITEINPPEDFATSRFTTDLDILNRDYTHARETGKLIMETWKS